MSHPNKALFITIISMLLLGCNFSRDTNTEIKTEVTKYNISIFASREANMNSIGEPAPLKINIFNLRSENEFMNLDFFSLHNNPTSVLGSNLLSHKQIYLLSENEPVNISGEVTSEYNYIGISGEFQDLNNKTWRTIIPIEPIEKTPFYKFWLTQPSQKEIYIIVDKQGIHVVKDGNKKK